MALIKCPECGKKISENAESCPNCGEPTYKKMTKDISKINKKLVITIILVIFLIGIVSLFVFNKNKNISYISYKDYEKLYSNKSTAIVVVMMEKSKYCTQYKEVIKQLKDDISTPIYYFKFDKSNVLGVQGAPTTFIIKNGKMIDKITGYMDYDMVKDNLIKNGIK